jgi:putative glutamine amidotransferase
MRNFSGKCIGIIPLWDEEKQSIWMLPGYMEAILEQNAVPVVLPLTNRKDLLEQIAENLNGLLLPGGQDVDPALYGQEPREPGGEICRMRDEMENLLLRMVLERRVPFFGICRGLQFLNVFCGGSLYQDLPQELGGKVQHGASEKGKENRHRVQILPYTPLDQILRPSEITVSSYHHQGICDLGHGLRPMAKSDDGLIEAVCMRDYPFGIAVQWHPELDFKTSESSRRLFAAFVDACS